MFSDIYESNRDTKGARRKNMVMKGQALTIELLFYFMGVLLLVSMFYQMILTRTKITTTDYTAFKKQFMLFEASEALIMTAGSPKHWEVTKQPTTLGLATRDNTITYHHQLDEKKINALNQMSLDDIKKALRLTNYNISITITDEHNNTLLSIPKTSQLKGTTIKRIALCGRASCELKLTAG